MSFKVVRLSVLAGGLLAVALASWCCFTGQTSGAENDADVTGQAMDILEKHCVSCHSGKKPKGDLNLLDRGDVVDVTREVRIIVPSKPDASELLKRVTDAERPMPPKKEKDALSKENVEALRKWIESGAEFRTVKADIKAKDEVKPALSKETDLAQKAYAVLDKNCGQCHGIKKQSKQLNVLSMESLLDEKRKNKVVVKSKPDDSELIKRVLDKDTPMPPGADPLSKDDVAVLKEWIAAGAPAFPDARTVAEVKPPPSDLPPAGVPQIRTGRKVTPQEIEKILRVNCERCHSGSKPEAGLRVLNHADLLKSAVKPKDANSELILRVKATDATRMPPPGQGQGELSAEDKEALEAWVLDGAKEWQDVILANDKNTGSEYVLNAIAADVDKLKKDDKQDEFPFYRYISFNHLVAAGVTADELKANYQALTLAINHLTWKKNFAKLRPIDPPLNSVWCLDIRQLGWERRCFSKPMKSTDPTKSGRHLNYYDLILLEYPYGTTLEASRAYRTVADDYLQNANQVRPVAYVRGDWLLSNATRSPLYEDLLQLPFDLAKLEERMGVDSALNVERAEAKRAGMTVSGVSRNNRVVERHEPTAPGFTYYWKSFDFKTNKGLENMFRDPIDLHQVGGEMVMSLPNGLQFYYVCDAKGNRIDAAPTEIVTDKNASDQVVRNGLACMRCHELGIRRFEDDVRPGLADLRSSVNFDLRHMQRLYPSKKQMDDLIARDETSFKDALKRLFPNDKIHGGVLTAPSQRFLDEKISGKQAVAELGVTGDQFEKDLLAFRSSRSVEMGLPQLSAGGVVRRDAWEEQFDSVVKLLGEGTPVAAIDAVTRTDYRPVDLGWDVEPSLNKPGKDTNNKVQIVMVNKSGRSFFAAGDKLEVQVINNTGKEVYVEPVLYSFKGEKYLINPRVAVPAGKTMTLPQKGPITIDAAVGKEELVFYVTDQEQYPQGEMLFMDPKARENDGKEIVSDRFVHPIYEDATPGKKLPFDPARMVKRTFEIETR